MNHKRLFIVFLLGFSSGLPLALVTSTLQAWFAESGRSVLETGLLSLVGLPYVYRMLWGPLLDRYRVLPLGLRRGWILVMQIGLLIGFNLMAACSPNHCPQWMALLALAMACFSATQDACIDAHRTEYLPVSQHALGASLAIVAYRVALLMAGGLALVMAAHWGFAATYRLMSLGMLLGIIAIIVSQEPLKHKCLSPNKLLTNFADPFKELATRRGFLSLVAFILFYKLGEAFTTSTSGIIMPFLIQGLGFSLETIGYINKILGVVTVLLGGLLAGFILLRCSLYRSLFWFGILQALTNLLFVILAFVGKNVSLLAIAVAADNFAAGMGSTAIVALFMRLVNQQFTATQFSLLVAIATLPRILSGPIAALLQMELGWLGLYALSFILAFGFIPFLRRIKPMISSHAKDAYELQTEGVSEHISS